MLSKLIIKRLRFLIKFNYENKDKTKLFSVISLYEEGKNEYLYKYLLILYKNIENGKKIKTKEMKAEILKYHQ